MIDLNLSLNINSELEKLDSKELSDSSDSFPSCGSSTAYNCSTESSSEDLSEAASLLVKLIEQEKVISKDVQVDKTKGLDKETQFTVLVEPLENWAKLAIKVAKWKYISQTKLRQLDKESLSKAAKKSKARLGDSCIVFDDMLRTLDKISLDSNSANENAKDLLSIYICRDQAQKIHAIAMHRIQSGTLELLATHPKNICLPDQEPRVKGAATAIMKTLILDAYKKNKSLTLFPLDSACGFYENLGFKSKVFGMKMDICPADMEATITRKGWDKLN